MLSRSNSAAAQLRRVGGKSRLSMDSRMTVHPPTDAPAPARPDASDAARTAARRRIVSWRRGPARDVLLVLLGAGLAIAAEEWRDARQRRARVDALLNHYRRALAMLAELR